MGNWCSDLTSESCKTYLANNGYSQVTCTPDQMCHNMGPDYVANCEGDYYMCVNTNSPTNFPTPFPTFHPTNGPTKSPTKPPITFIDTDINICNSITEACSSQYPYTYDEVRGGAPYYFNWDYRYTLTSSPLDQCGAGEACMCGAEGTSLAANANGFIPCFNDICVCKATSSPTETPTRRPTTSPTASPTLTPNSEKLILTVIPYTVDNLGIVSDSNMTIEIPQVYSYSDELNPLRIIHNNSTLFMAEYSGSTFRLTDIKFRVNEHLTEDKLFSVRIYKKGMLVLDLQDHLAAKDMSRVSCSDTVPCEHYSSYQSITDAGTGQKTHEDTISAVDVNGVCKMPFILAYPISFVKHIPNPLEQSFLCDYEYVFFRIPKGSLEYLPGIMESTSDTSGLKLVMTQIDSFSNNSIMFGKLKAYDKNNHLLNDDISVVSQTGSTNPNSAYCIQNDFSVYDDCYITPLKGFKEFKSQCCAADVSTSTWTLKDSKICDGSSKTNALFLYFNATDINNCKLACMKDNSCVGFSRFEYQPGEYFCYLMSSITGVSKDPLGISSECYVADTIYSAHPVHTSSVIKSSQISTSYIGNCNTDDGWSKPLSGPDDECSRLVQSGDTWLNQQIYKPTRSDVTQASLTYSLPEGTVSVFVEMAEQNVSYTVLENGLAIDSGRIEKQSRIVIDDNEKPVRIMINSTLFELYHTICPNDMSEVFDSVYLTEMFEAGDIDSIKMCTNAKNYFINGYLNRFQIVLKALLQEILDVKEMYSFGVNIDKIVEREKHDNGELASYESILSIVKLFNILQDPIECKIKNGVQDMEAAAKEVYNYLHFDGYVLKCTDTNLYTMDGENYVGGKNGAPCVANHQCHGGLICTNWQCDNTYSPLKSICRNPTQSIIQPDYHVLRPATIETRKCTKREIYHDESTWDYEETNGQYSVTPRWEKTKCDWNEPLMKLSPAYFKTRGNMQECGTLGSSELYDIGVSFTEGFFGFDECPASHFETLWNNYKGKSFRLIPHDIPDTMKINFRDVTGRENNYKSIANAIAFTDREYIENLIQYQDALCNNGFLNVDGPVIDFGLYKEECDSYTDCHWHSTLKTCVSSSEFVEKKICSVITDRDQCLMSGSCKYEWGLCISKHENIGKDISDCKWSECMDSAGCDGLSDDYTTNGFTTCRGGLFSDCPEHSLCGWAWQDRYKCCKVDVEDTSAGKEIDKSTLCGNQKTMSGCFAWDCSWDVILDVCVKDETEVLDDGQNYTKKINERITPYECDGKNHSIIRWEDTSDKNVFIEICFANNMSQDVCNLYGFIWNLHSNTCQKHDLIYNLEYNAKYGGDYMDNFVPLPDDWQGAWHYNNSVNTYRDRGIFSTNTVLFVELHMDDTTMAEVYLKACESQGLFCSQDTSNHMIYYRPQDVITTLNVNPPRCETITLEQNCRDTTFCDWFVSLQSCAFVGGGGKTQLFYDPVKMIYDDVFSIPNDWETNTTWADENVYTGTILNLGGTVINAEDNLFITSLSSNPCSRMESYDDCSGSEMCFWSFTTKSCEHHRCQFISNMYPSQIKDDYSTYGGTDYDHELPILTQSCHRIDGCNMNNVSYTCEDNAPTTEQSFAEDTFFCSQFSDLNDGLCNYYSPTRQHVCLNIHGECQARYLFIGSMTEDEIFDMASDYASSVRIFNLTKTNILKLHDMDSEIPIVQFLTSLELQKLNIGKADLDWYDFANSTTNVDIWTPPFPMMGNVHFETQTEASACLSSNGTRDAANEVSLNSNENDCKTRCIELGFRCKGFELTALEDSLYRCTLWNDQVPSFQSSVSGNQCFKRMDGVKTIQIVPLEDLSGELQYYTTKSLRTFELGILVHDIFHRFRGQVHRKLSTLENTVPDFDGFFKHWKELEIHRLFYPIPDSEILVVTIENLKSLLGTDKTQIFLDNLSNESPYLGVSDVNTDVKFLKNLILHISVGSTPMKYDSMFDELNEKWGVSQTLSETEEQIKDVMEEKKEEANGRLRSELVGNKPAGISHINNRLAFDLLNDAWTGTLFTEDYILENTLPDGILSAWEFTKEIEITSLPEMTIESFEEYISDQLQTSFENKIDNLFKPRPVSNRGIPRRKPRGKVTMKLNRVFDSVNKFASNIENTAKNHLKMLRNRLRPDSVLQKARSVASRSRRSVQLAKKTKTLSKLFKGLDALKLKANQASNAVRIMKEMASKFKEKGLQKLGLLKNTISRSLVNGQSGKLLAKVSKQFIKVGAKLARTAIGKAGIAIAGKLAYLAGGPAALVLLLLDIGIEIFMAASAVSEAVDAAYEKPVGCRYIHDGRYASNLNSAERFFRIGVGGEDDLLISENQCSQRATYAYLDSNGSMSFIDSRYNVPTCTNENESFQLDNYFSSTLNHNCNTDSDCSSISICVIGKCVFDVGYLGNKICNQKLNATKIIISSSALSGSGDINFNGIDAPTQAFWNDMLLQGKSILSNCGSNRYVEVGTTNYGLLTNTTATCFSDCNYWDENIKSSTHTFVRKMYTTENSRQQCNNEVDCPWAHTCVKGNYCVKVTCSDDNDCYGPWSNDLNLKCSNGYCSTSLVLLPTGSPVPYPTRSPIGSSETANPTSSPSTSEPSISPSNTPHKHPTSSPSRSPTILITNPPIPTFAPVTLTPTMSPTKSPTSSPTVFVGHLGQKTGGGKLDVFTRFDTIGGKMKLSRSANIDDDEDAINLHVYNVKERDINGIDVESAFKHLLHKVVGMNNVRYNFETIDNYQLGTISTNMLNVTSTVFYGNVDIALTFYTILENGIHDGVPLNEGDTKFDISMTGWPFCLKNGVGINRCLSDGEYVDIELTVNGRAGAYASATKVSGKVTDLDLGGGINLNLIDDINVDGTWTKMPDGFPKLVQTGADTRVVFRFPKFNQRVFYDPTFQGQGDTKNPTTSPTVVSPSKSPTTYSPTASPMVPLAPSVSPSSPTTNPTTSPSKNPTESPTVQSPTVPTQQPTFEPTQNYENIITHSSHVCDTQNTNCNVLNGYRFDYKTMEIVTFSPNNSTVVGGEQYEFVIQYNTEFPFELLRDIKICAYSISTQMNCSKTKMWLNGTLASSNLHVDSDGLNCCTFDTFGVFTRENILNTYDNLFFLMDNAVSSGSRLIFQRTNDVIVPDDIAILYSMWLNETSLTIDGDSTKITMVVKNVNHTDNIDFNNSNCSNTTEIMTSINLNGCTLMLTNTPLANTFEYNLLSLDYEQCASSVVNEGDFVVYQSFITLPGKIDDCYYFQPGNDIQPISIRVNSTSETIITPDSLNIGVTISNIDSEPCLPYEDYVLVHHQIIFDVKYTFNGTDVYLNGTPYLDSPSNPLILLNKTCVSNECVFTFKTSQCQRIYETDDGTGCVFDRNDRFIIYDLSVTEIGNPYNPASHVHTINSVDSSVELIIFPPSHCEVPNYINFVDVTDQYNYILLANNLPSPNWNSSVTILDFFENVILKLEITDTLAFQKQDLQIQTVEFKLTDGSADITKLVFRIQDKVALMGFSENLMFKDPNFCRYSEEGSCGHFYNSTSARTNEYVETVLFDRLDDMCQLHLDDTKTDFFSLFFPFWINRIDTSYLRFYVTVTARIEVCKNVVEYPIAVNGYYPLYFNADSANNAGDGTSHTHVLNSVTYYMPNGVSFWHGDYIESSPLFQSQNMIEIQYIETEPQQIDFLFNATNVPSPTPTSHTHTPTSHIHAHVTFDGFVVIFSLLVSLLFCFIGLFVCSKNNTKTHNYHHIIYK